MKRLISIFFGIILLVFCSTITLANVGSTDLIEKGKEFDGRMVTYTGEAIGDPMARGDFVWLNVKDNDNAMGIWVNKSILPQIKYYGFYRSIGDTLVIQGTFHRSCIEHGGDMDIHATEVSVSEVGRPVEHRVQRYQYIWTVIMLFTAGVAFYLSRRGNGRKGEEVGG